MTMCLKQIRAIPFANDIEVYYLKRKNCKRFHWKC